MQAWDAVVREFTRQSVIVDSAADLVLEQEVPDILCSALVDDCIARGKHLKEGGAVYDFVSGLQVGIANLADSLAAIRKLVFAEQAADRAGAVERPRHATSKARTASASAQMLLRDAPKYGNDIEEVDLLAARAYGSYLDEIGEVPQHPLRQGTDRRHVLRRDLVRQRERAPGSSGPPPRPTAARPVSRWRRAARRATASDTRGPTAVFTSVSRLPDREDHRRRAPQPEGDAPDARAAGEPPEARPADQDLLQRAQGVPRPVQRRVAGDAARGAEDTPRSTGTSWCASPATAPSSTSCRA